VPRVIRIFRFRLAEPQFDDELRRVLLPDLLLTDGVLDVYGGRRDRPNPDERIVASVWTDRDAMVAALGDSIEGSRRGTVADRDAGRGPLALYLSCADDDSFSTLSVWPDWATLQDATGGNLGRPIATRHADRLVEWTASHYEVMGPD